MKKQTRYILLALVLVVVVGSIWYLESRKAGTGGSAEVEEVTTLTDEEKEARYEPAKEITTPDAFINTDGISIEELIGEKVVLVDFWTYSCINCQRTLPHLNSWHQKYEDDGLVIIGVHTPEFEFEKKFENVRQAVEKYNVEYPVVLDNDFSTWRAYKNRYWPRKYLIDIDGYIVYDHIGEGAYDETEDKIVELLRERNEQLGIDRPVDAEDDQMAGEEVDFERIETPEIYFGSSRIEHLVNLPSQSCYGSVCGYELPAEVPSNTFAFGGSWQINEEEATTAEGGAVIRLNFTASKVNFVAGADMPVSAEIYLDGERVDVAAGRDVKDGSVTIREHDLYNLIDLGGDYSEHVLEIRVSEPGLDAFTFTFG